MEDFKVFMNELLQRNISINKRDTERWESFCSGSVLDTSVNFIEVDNTISTQTETLENIADETTNEERFINERF